MIKRYFAALFFSFCLLATAIVPAQGGPIVKADNPFDKYGTVSNGTCADPSASVCGAASMINSWVFLRNRYKTISTSNIIPDLVADGVIDRKDYEKARDNLGIDGWPDPANPGDASKRRKGFYRRDGTTQSDWEAKVDWLDDFAPDLITFKGQIKTAKDVSTWKRGGALENKFPNWDFIWEQIRNGEDVEIAFKGGATFHAVTLTGLEFEDSDMNGKFDAGEKRKIRFMDPNQADKTKPSEAELLADGADGDLRFKYGADGVGLLYAFSESPKDHTLVPGPSSFALLSIGTLGLFGFNRRCRRQESSRRARQMHPARVVPNEDLGASAHARARHRPA